MNEKNKDENIELISIQETTQGEALNTKKNNASKKNPSGPIVGTIIIVILLIVGGIYFWNTAVNKSKEVEKLPTIQSGGETGAVVNQLESQGTSDKITDIETDLKSTNLKNLDSGLNNLINGL